ncbi:hypothetical protein [Providencia sp. PROV250]|uniref:hypothetical protein n=1 Tax=Providencia TaxID=586 RepID=UPI00234B836A|nr:hypothetical protein [Providencia sp. PROV250]
MSTKLKVSLITIAKYITEITPQIIPSDIIGEILSKNMNGSENIITIPASHKNDKLIFPKDFKNEAKQKFKLIKKEIKIA